MTDCDVGDRVAPFRPSDSPTRMSLTHRRESFLIGMAMIEVEPEDSIMESFLPKSIHLEVVDSGIHFGQESIWPDIECLIDSADIPSFTPFDFYRLQLLGKRYRLNFTFQ
jgi:hypothetical protein